MKFLIISHAPHKTKEEAIFSYAPYVREMNIWLKYADAVEVVAPLISNTISKIDMRYQHNNLSLTQIPAIQFTSITKTFISFLRLPIIFYKIFKACQRTDHIHLRCPGNIGLLGCLVQIFFPKKIKTAKYAGNWDPKAKQPLSYRFQKWLLSNTFLTKNITVLVYGEWKKQTKNIKPFFTASFLDSEKENLKERDYSKALRFVFIGSLVEGKQPLLAIQIIEALHKQRKHVHLDIYGEGVLNQDIQQYISDNKIENHVFLHGNQNKEVIKKAFNEAHFSILPSKSEGWPKAITEAMFFGVIPMATSVSCVPHILDYGNRGILIKGNLKADIIIINKALNDSEMLKSMSEKALNWSQNFTLDVFEKEISKLLNN